MRNQIGLNRQTEMHVGPGILKYICSVFSVVPRETK